MKFFNFKPRNKKTQGEERSEERNAPLGALMLSSGSSFRSYHAMQLSAVNRCVSVISDAVAQLQIHAFTLDKNGYMRRDFDNPITTLLNNRPSERMTRFMFMKCMVASMLLNGNSYAYIQRDNHGRPKSLVYIPHEFVTVVEPLYIDQAPTYTITGMNQPVKSQDIIHLMNYTENGLEGISVIRHAYNVLSLAHAAENHAKNFFESGCSFFGLLKTDSPVQKEEKKRIRKEWDSSREQNGAASGVVILDYGLEYQQVTVNPGDAQLLQSREYSISEIARMFSVPPSKLYERQSVSYSSLESDQLSFLVDCIQPLVTKIESEFQRKLFPADNKITLKFQCQDLIRLDQKSQAEYYSKLVACGIMQINECRLALGLPEIENGNTNFVPVNQMSIDKAILNGPTDNKVVTEDIDVKQEN